MERKGGIEVNWDNSHRKIITSGGRAGGRKFSVKRYLVNKFG